MTRKKIIIFLGSFLAVFLLVLTPIIPAVQNQVKKDTFREKILEINENIDNKSLKEILNHFSSDFKKLSTLVLNLKGLLEKLDKFSKNKDKYTIVNSFSNLLLSIIGIVCISFGAFTMYFGSGKSRLYGSILAITGFFLFIL